MKYLKAFNSHNDYLDYVNSSTFSNLEYDSVSYCIQQNDVHFNKYIQKFIAKYNVTSTSEPTTLLSSYASAVFKSMEIDGVKLNNLVTEYTFDTTGEHIVKYELIDETQLGNNMPIFLNNNLIEVIIPDCVINIGDVAFVNCYSLTNITIPNNVKNIGSSAFGGLNITNVVIGDGIENISTAAFNNCNNLTSITIKATTPSYLGNSVFDGQNNYPIYVPAESVETYKATIGWGEYADRIQAIPEQ